MAASRPGTLWLPASHARFLVLTGPCPLSARLNCMVRHSDDAHVDGPLRRGRGPSPGAVHCQPGHRQDAGGARRRGRAGPGAVPGRPAVDVDKYIGETEKNLERVFDDAQDQRRAVLRRGRRPVREVLRGQRRERPIRQPGGCLPAPAHGEFDGITSSPPACGQPRPGVRPPLQRGRRLPDPDCRPASGSGTRTSAAPDQDVDDPVHVARLAAGVEPAAATSATSCWPRRSAAVDAGEPVGMRHVLEAVRQEH